MHTIDLIARSIGANDPEYPCLPELPIMGICAVTGDECQTVHRKTLLANYFTDGALLLSPDSDRVGVNAYVALKYKWERKSSWICDGHTFRRLTKNEILKEVLADTQPDQWAAYVTTSFKKHGSLRAPINRGNQRKWLFETMIVDCSDTGLVADWWERLNRMFAVGAGRTILKTLDCPPYLIKKVGIETWIQFQEWAIVRIGYPLYNFLIYLLPSKEKGNACDDSD